MRHKGVHVRHGHRRTCRGIALQHRDYLPSHDLPARELVGRSVPVSQQAGRRRTRHFSSPSQPSERHRAAKSSSHSRRPGRSHAADRSSQEQSPIPQPQTSHISLKPPSDHRRQPSSNIGRSALRVVRPVISACRSCRRQADPTLADWPDGRCGRCMPPAALKTCSSHA